MAGFFLAPNVSGYVMDQYANPKEGLIAGYRLVLGWNVFTLLFLFAATGFSYRAYKRRYGAKGGVQMSSGGNEEEVRIEYSLDNND